MFAKLFGVFWIVLGLLWLIKPELLRKRLARKMTRKLKWIIFGLMFLLAVQLLGWVFQNPGIFSWIALILGWVVLVRTALSLSAKSSETLVTWAAQVPVQGLRIWASVVLATGLVLFFS